MWYSEVRRGYEFYYQSGRRDLKPPVQSEVFAYYRERAPIELDLKESENSTPSPVAFRVQPIVLNAANSKPAISFIDWMAAGEGRGRLRVSDMRSGEISLVEPSTSSHKLLTNSSSNPAATCVCDLDGDGRPDLVIADLGSFLPEDHDRGRVIWIPNVFRGGSDDIKTISAKAGQRRSEAGSLSRIDENARTILANVGRVADVRAADFDGDGDEDLVVAEFGWHRTGGIHMMWNDGIDAVTGERRFRDEKIDHRSGAIHVPTVDLNGDGRIDFIALFSQEFEVVVAFLNLPDGFQKQSIFIAPDPSFGSSGIELIDFDRDGDLDVLYTNGDTFDSYLLKPSHSVKWLENEGTFPFKVHHVAAMPGVNRARAADLDGDGDFDIVAAALIPNQLLERGKNISLGTVVWFEQTDAGSFERHTLKTGSPAHATLEVADMDDDGDIDIVVGCFFEEAEVGHPALLMFWNDGRTHP